MMKDNERDLASNPNISPEFLRELAESEDAEIRQQVAANPNTPLEVLFKLGVEFPEELLNNPIFSLLFLEDPNFLTKLPRETLVSILKCETVPVSFLDWAAQPYQESFLKLAVAQNISTPVNILEDLATGIFLGRYGYELAQNPNMPAMVLEKLAKHLDEPVRWLVVQHPNISSRALEILAKDDSISREGRIKVAVAKNHKTPAQVLANLGKYKTFYENIRRDVRVAVITNPNTPLPVLKKLVVDKNPAIQLALAPDSPRLKAVWLELIKENSPKVVSILLSNRHISPDFLEELAQHSHKDVQLFVAKHPCTPVKFLAKWASCDMFNFRVSVARNLSTPAEILRELAGDSVSGVRISVASNPNTPADVLELLTRDKDNNVRLCADKNLNKSKNEVSLSRKFGRHG